MLSSVPDSEISEAGYSWETLYFQLLSALSTELLKHNFENKADKPERFILSSKSIMQTTPKLATQLLKAKMHYRWSSCLEMCYWHLDSKNSKEGGDGEEANILVQNIFPG